MSTSARAYPVQTADRKCFSVDWGNQAAKNRLLNTLGGMKVGVIGEYHSHTKVGYAASLSSIDLGYYLRESISGRDIIGNDWIELIIRISEKEAEADEASIYGDYNYIKAERFKISLPSKLYDITLSGWFIESKNDKPTSRQGTVCARGIHKKCIKNLR